MTSVIFQKNGHFCIVPRDIGESYERFLDRGYFIIDVISKNKENFDKILILSRIWANIKYDDMVYDNEIMLEIDKLLKNTN